MERPDALFCRVRGTTSRHGWSINDTNRTLRSGDGERTVTNLITNGHRPQRFINGGDMMNWLHGKDGRDLIAGGLLIVIG
ncbi:MAG: hypothetical protein Q8R21_05460, partial [Burkholderiales bacterium]|nr:hypothetical protein [Burkholderiales bacterium]